MNASSDPHFEAPSYTEGTTVEAWADDSSEDSDWAISAASNVSLQGTDWTVETILSQLRQANIDVTPHFQRRSVWSPARMSRFIESLFMGFPIPQLVLAADKTKRGAFIVLDGKQRLTALRQFALETEESAALRLTGLDLLPDLNGRTLKELTSDKKFEDDVRAFMNTTLRTVVISNWSDDRYLNLVFHRLNTGSVALSSQELRQALYPGDFSTRVDSFAATSQSLHNALRTSEADFRMRDTELALRFIAFHRRLPEYAGNLKQFLDETTETYNKSWQSEERSINSSLRSLESSIDVSLEVFGDNAFRRFVDGKYESLFNRAIFDVQSLYFSVPDIAAAARSNPAGVKTAFEQLLTTDSEFAQSVSSTTKSLGATYYRLQKWGEALSGALNVKFSLPVQAERNRISWDLLV